LKITLLNLSSKNLVYKNIMFENTYVKNVYNEIAETFDVSRCFVWNCVEKFVSTLNGDELILEVGCGNGKNMKYLLDQEFINVQGCDFSKELVNICKNNKLNVIEGNILNLPYQDNSFDVLMCVAVLHHISNLEDRKRAICELIRVTKPNGKIFITVNSTMEFSKNVKHLSDTDIVIYLDDKNKSNELYYHLFSAEELTNLCINATGVKDIYETYNNGHRIGIIYVDK
jgi:ubiquinone/menaquinone biosynthesis C-methylase UbiE